MISSGVLNNNAVHKDDGDLFQRPSLARVRPLDFEIERSHYEALYGLLRFYMVL